MTNISNRRLLLLSNSRDEEGRFLHHAGSAIKAHLSGVSSALFIPYAAVTLNWDAYADLVRKSFEALGIAVHSLHESADPVAEVAQAESIVIGGGNTFHLLAELQRLELMSIIRERAMNGTPYIGWSAGSVVACPTMQTTNDMPIVEPVSFKALSLVQFQINAHFTDVHPPGFQGETRRQRLAEYVTANANVSVIGLPEGTWLNVVGESVTLGGAHDAPIFHAGAADVIAESGSELGALLEP